MSLMRRLAWGGVATWVVVALLLALVWAVSLPARFTRAGSIVVGAPIETVYGAVSDGRGLGARWGAGHEILSHATSDWTEGIPTTEVQGASRFAHQVQVADRPVTFVTEFVEASGVVGTSTWTFEPLDPSTTRVTLVQDAEVSHPLTRALHSLRRTGHADIRGQLRALERAISGGEQS